MNDRASCTASSKLRTGKLDFKHCHGRKAQGRTSPEDSTWHRLRRVLDGYPTMMLNFVRDVYWSGALQEAWAEFVLWEDEMMLRAIRRRGAESLQRWTRRRLSSGPFVAYDQV